MKANIPEGVIIRDSWAEDFTQSMYCRQNYMYVQCMGSFNTNMSYRMLGRKNLESYLIISVLDGSGMLEYQGIRTELSKGSIAIIDCRKEHSYYCNCENGWNFRWLHFSGNSIPGYMEELSQVNLPVVSDKLSKDLEELMELAETRQADGAYELKCSNALIRFCMDLLYEVRIGSGEVEKKLLPVVKDATRLLAERFAEKISLEDICKELNISKFYFSRVFKEQIGVSPYEYLINLRLGYAKTLLRSTSHDMLEIAGKAGFEDCSYFISVFRKREGITPLKYRKMFIG